MKLKLEVVGIPAEKEWGTAETLRCVLSLLVNELFHGCVYCHSR
jgi:hypothetical protein